MIDLDQFRLNGKFLMLALDHRGSIKKIINPGSPRSVSDQKVVQLKREIINSVIDQCSGILVDEAYGLQAYQKHQKPFLLPLEESGDQSGERVTQIQRSSQDLIRLGASGAKVLFYFNPDVPSAHTQLDLARQVLKDCQKNGLPLFLEIRVYKVDTGDEVGEDVERLVLESLGQFINAGIKPAVWKLEYPGSSDACLDVTELVGQTPWILLTKGSSFEVFKGQLTDAIQSGAKGFLAGRSLWQEVCKLEGKEKERFLKETLPERFKTIAEIARID